MAFDPTQFGATPVTAPTTVPPASSAPTFNPASFGATPVAAPSSTVTPAFDPKQFGATPVQNTNSLKGTKDVLGAFASGASSGWNDGVTESFNPADWGTAVEKAYSDSIDSASTKLDAAFDNWKTDTTSGKIGDVGEAGLGALQALFTPIVAPFAGVEKVPIVGLVAKGMNALMSAVGQGEGQAATYALQTYFPKLVPTLGPIVRDSAAFASQLAIGSAMGGKGVDEEALSDQGVARADGAVAKQAALKTPPPGGGVGGGSTPTTPTDLHPIVSKLHDNLQTILSTVKSSDIAGPVTDAVTQKMGVDSTGKQDIRTVMTGLNEAGYSPKQLSDIMGKIIENNNTGRFTPKEVSDVARQYTPANRDYPVSRVNKGDTSKPYTFKKPPVVANTEIAPMDVTKTAPEDGQTAVDTTAKAPSAQPETGSTENLSSVIKDKTEVSPEKVTTDAKTLENHFKDDPQFKGTSFKEQSEIFNQFLKEDRAKLLDIATEKVPTERGAVPSAMAELFAKDKNLTGEEAARLGKTPYATSKGGQALSLSRIADGDSTLDNLQKATEAKKGGEKTQANVKAETKTAKEVISKTRAKLLDYEDVLKKITC